MEEGAADLRIGCARDAGGLRSLAHADDDLVAALDFNPGARPEQLQQEMQQVVDGIHADQSNGLSLGRSLTLSAEKNSVGYYVQQSDGIDYDGSIQIAGDSLVIVVSSGDIGTTGFWDVFWRKFVAGAVAAATAVAVGALCLAFFNVGAPAAAPVCGAVSGAVGGGVNELVSAALDGKPIDGDAWGAALAGAIWGALGGGFAGQLMQFATARATTLLTRLHTTIRTWAEKLGAWGNPLGYVADLLTTDMADRLLATLRHLSRGLDGTNVPEPLRIMPLGDSITYGSGSSNGWGYRGDLELELAQQNGTMHYGAVQYLGSQQSGPALNDDNNEGHPGWLIGDIAGIADSVLATYRPDVVLLHIGTNDMNNNVDPGGAPARLGSLIDQILRDDPQVTVLVSTIVPAAFPDTAARIATYNAAIPGVVQARQAAGKRVSLVRMDAVTTADLADGLHPNNRGYQKMAEAFYDGIVTVAQAGGIAASGSGTSPVGGPVKGWFPQGTIASGTFSGGAGTAEYADIDGDGKADYLQVNDDSSVQAWINGGPHDPKDGSVGGNTDWLWYPQGTIASGVGAAGSKIHFADLNGDGKADYLQINDDSSVQAWINGGPNPQNPTGSDWLWFPQQTVASGVNASGARVRFAPLYGKPSADYVLLGSSNDANYDSSVQVWENGGFDFLDWYWYPGGTVASGVGVDGARIQFADLDGDGRADYLDVDPQSGATRAWINFG